MTDELFDIDRAFEQAFNDGALDLADRCTVVPDFDLRSFAREAMREVEEAEPTRDIPEAKLGALVSKSIPPTCFVGLDHFAAVALTPEELASRALSPGATHLISLIDGRTPLAVVVMESGLPHGQAMTALRELYTENAISMA